MKKSLVVLLIAVLALSAVFAADVAITATGEVEASYVYDFDDLTATYNVPSLNGALAWEVVLPVAKAGSQYPYINVAGEIEVDLTNVAFYLAPEVEFDKFEIVGEDWRVDFLASIGTLDYAVSAIDTTWYAPKNAYALQTGRYVSSDLTYRWTTAAYGSDAVAVSKDGVGKLTLLASVKDGEGSTDYICSFTSFVQAEDYVETMNSYCKLTRKSYQYIVDDSNYQYTGKVDVYKITPDTDESSVYAVEAESAEIKLADSVTTQFGFGFGKTAVETTDSMTFGFSSKAAYEDILSLAYDFGYNFDPDEGLKDPETKYSFDVAVAFEYDMVSFDAYFAHGYLSYNNSEDVYLTNMYKYYSTVVDEDGEDEYFDNLLSVKASVDVEEIGTKFTFTGKDLLACVDDAYLEFESVNTYFDNYTFTFDVSTYVDTTLYDAEVEFKAEADYEEEVGVSAYADVVAYSAKSIDFAAGIAYEKDGLSLSVDFSTAVEDYLTTTARYDSDGDLVENDYPEFALAVEAGYEAEVFTLSGAIEYNTHEKSAKSYRPWTLCDGLYITTGIESDKLVDGATLSLAYESADLLSNGYYDEDGEELSSLGSITAACTVEF